MNEQTQTGAPGKRGRPAKQQAGTTQTTASGGNARRAQKRLTLTDRVRAMESSYAKINRLADQIKQTARRG
jgi:hypothetical protein